MKYWMHSKGILQGITENGRPGGTLNMMECMLF